MPQVEKLPGFYVPQVDYPVSMCHRLKDYLVSICHRLRALTRLPSFHVSGETNKGLPGFHVPQQDESFN